VATAAAAASAAAVDWKGESAGAKGGGMVRGVKGVGTIGDEGEECRPSNRSTSFSLVSAAESETKPSTTICSSGEATS
jgi:hypothetical protein